jgi:hypothetical protein
MPRLSEVTTRTSLRPRAARAARSTLATRKTRKTLSAGTASATTVSQFGLR